MDSNKNLPNNKDLQVLFAGGPKICPTNPRWRAAAISNNQKIVISQ